MTSSTDWKKNSGNLLKTVFENSPVGILTADKNGLVTSINDAYLKILGNPEGRDLIVKKFNLLDMDIFKIAGINQQIKDLFEKQQPFEVEVNLLTTFGRDINGYYRGNPVLDNSGQLESVIIILEDITEYKSSQQQAAVGIESRNRLLANVSHELRTPLNAILGYSEMLEGGYGGELSEEQHELLSRIVTNSHQMIALVNNLLDQAQISENSIHLNIGEFAPQELFNNLRAAVEVLVEAKGLKYSQEIDPSMPATLRGDFYRLQQILINIVNNAIKFTEEGFIHARMQAFEENWILQISDTGVGLTLEDLEKVFEPFEQVKSSMDHTHRGAGLGLSIVKQLVDLMDGEIEINSAPGSGSTFTISLPL